MARKVTPLRIAVASSGRTQREIAEEVGINETRLSQIVNGHWNPDADLRARLAEAVNGRVDELWPELRAAA